MASLQEIRAKLLAQETRNTGEPRVMDNAIYPFWKLWMKKYQKMRSKNGVISGMFLPSR